MNNTPRIEAVIAPARDLNPATDFVKLAATYSDLLQLARTLERELAEANRALAKAETERDAAIAKDHESIAADRLVERALGRAEGAMSTPLSPEAMEIINELHGQVSVSRGLADAASACATAYSEVLESVAYAYPGPNDTPPTIDMLNALRGRARKALAAGDRERARDSANGGESSTCATETPATGRSPVEPLTGQFPNIRKWCRGSPESIVIYFAGDLTNEQIDALPKALMAAIAPRVVPCSEDSRIAFIRNQAAKAVPQPHHHGEAPSPTWDQIRVLLAEVDRLNGKPEENKHDHCFNDTPGATLCQVCGGDL